MPPKAETLPKAETVHETPSQSFVKDRNPVHTVTDERDRVIRYRNLSILEQARLARACGEFANNLPYMRMLAFAACVLDIDGDRGPPKTTTGHLEHRLDWLGDEGYEAMEKDAIHRAEMAEENGEADGNQQAKN